MAMGRSRSALPDLDESIKLNPKFYQVCNNYKCVDPLLL